MYSWIQDKEPNASSRGRKDWRRQMLYPSLSLQQISARDGHLTAGDTLLRTKQKYPTPFALAVLTDAEKSEFTS